MNRHAILLIATAPLAGSACQAYRPRPVDVSEYARRWSERTIEDDAVRRWAERLVVPAAPGGAPAPFDAADGLSLAEAEAVALCFNPELRRRRLEARVHLAGAAEAGRLDDPELDLEILRITESVDDEWILGVGLAFTIPLSGRLGVERDQARAESNAARAEVLVEERRVVRTLRETWLRWSALREQVTLLTGHRARVDQLRIIADSLAEAGELHPTAARILLIDAMSGQAELIGLESEAEGARLELMALLGLVPAAPVELLPSLALPATLVPDEQAHERLLAHPELELARQRYEVAEQSLRREIHRQYPDLTLGPAYELDEGQSRIGMAFGVPIPWLNANRRAIAEARARRAAAEVEIHATWEALVSRMARARTAHAAAERRHQWLAAEVAPLVDRQIEAIRRLAEMGELDVLLLEDALGRSLEMRRQMLAAALARGLAVAEVEDLIAIPWPAPDAKDARPDPENQP